MANDAPVPKTAAIDAAGVAPVTGSSYPQPHRQAVAGREKRRLGDAFGLTNFGVNLVRLPPGVMSSMRHWHSRQDEFVYMLEGEAVLITDAGEQTLRPGMIAGFPAGRPDGHHIVNRSASDAIYLEVGDRTPGDSASYSDVDLAGKQQPDGKWVYTRKDGSAY